MNIKTIAAGAIVSTVGFASLAQAASVSYNAPFGPTTVGVNGAVNLPQFNPALGTLTKVTLTLDANTNAGTLEWDNEGSGSGTVTLGIGTTLVATAPAALTATAVPVQVNAATVSADIDGAPDFTGSDAAAVTGGVGSDTDMAMLLAGLAPYIGLGNIPVSLTSTLFTSTITEGGNLFGPSQVVNGLYDGLVTIEYEYNLIPEPTSAALLGLGGLLALRRRR